MRTEFQGLRTAIPTNQAGRTLQALGAVPVRIPLDGMAIAIASDTIDDALAGYSVARELGLDDVAHYHTEADLYSAAFLLAMNKEVYRSLPPELQAAVDANANTRTELWVGSIFDEHNAAARAEVIADGGAFSHPAQPA